VFVGLIKKRRKDMEGEKNRATRWKLGEAALIFAETYCSKGKKGGQFSKSAGRGKAKEGSSGGWGI